MSVEKKDFIYEGKAKQVYTTTDENLVIIHYKDDATAGNGAKKGTIVNKGIMNNKITAMLFKMLEKNGIKDFFYLLRSINYYRRKETFFVDCCYAFKINKLAKIIVNRKKRRIYW